MNELSMKEVLKVLAPYLLLTALSTLLLVIIYLKFAPVPGRNAPVMVVTFDIIKYTNAQRAVASVFLGKAGDTAQAAETLSDLTERTREAIQEVAGKGTLVMVKQSVVQGQMMDITDEVLKRLKLPLDAPTADASEYAIDVAPTMWFIAPSYKKPAPVPGEGQTSKEIIP